MSETKHTSGPWEVGVHPANDRLHIVRPVLFGSKVVVLPECEGGHVALKNSADARLIAAAPELLDVLMAMRETVYEQPVGVWFYAIDAAIAKATGAAKDPDDQERGHHL